MPKKKKSSKADIFQLLLETSDKPKKPTRQELLASLKVKEFFDEGEVSINKRTCEGFECELCIKACPTSALYWQDGEVGITKELCVYCGACVLCCIVDDCIKVVRKRPNEKVESFSKPREVVLLCNSISSDRRHSRVESLFPDSETYLKRYGR